MRSSRRPPPSPPPEGAPPAGAPRLLPIGPDGPTPLARRGFLAGGLSAGAVLAAIGLPACGGEPRKVAVADEKSGGPRAPLARGISTTPTADLGSGPGPEGGPEAPIRADPCSSGRAHRGLLLGMGFLEPGTLFTAEMMKVTVWDPKTGERLRTVEKGRFPLRSRYVVAVGASGDRRRLGVAWDGAHGISLLDTRSWKVVGSIRTGLDFDWNVSLSSRIVLDREGGRAIATEFHASAGHAADGGRATGPAEEWGSVEVMAMSPDGAVAVMRGGSGVELWSTDPLAPILSLPDAGNLAAFSLDGRWLATLGTGGLRLWDLPARAAVAVDGSISCDSFRSRGWLGFTADGSRLVVTVRDSLQYRSVPDLAPVRSHPVPTGDLRCADASPDGALVAVGDEDGRVRVYRGDTGAFVTCLVDPEETPSNEQVAAYTHETEGRRRTFTAPCGGPLPAGASCTCNCVAGEASPVATGGGGGGETICVCLAV